MGKEKISNVNKKHIAKMGLKGKQFKELSNILNVCESTIRKANSYGTLLNKIDDLEISNRMKDVQISILQTKNGGIFRKTNRN